MKSAKSVALILAITLAFSVIGYTGSISSGLYAYAENSQQQKLNEDQNQSYNGTTTSDEEKNQTVTDNETNQQGENETGQHGQNESSSEPNSNQQGNDQKSYYNSAEGRGSLIISLGNDSKAGLV